MPRRLLNAQLDCAARTGDEAAAEILLRDLKATPGSVTVMTLASLVRLAGQAGMAVDSTLRGVRGWLAAKL